MGELDLDDLKIVEKVLRERLKHIYSQIGSSPHLVDSPWYQDRQKHIERVRGVRTKIKKMIAVKEGRVA